MLFFQQHFRQYLHLRRVTEQLDSVDTTAELHQLLGAAKLHLEPLVVDDNLVARSSERQQSRLRAVDATLSRAVHRHQIRPVVDVNVPRHPVEADAMRPSVRPNHRKFSGHIQRAQLPVNQNLLFRRPELDLVQDERQLDVLNFVRAKLAHVVAVDDHAVARAVDLDLVPASADVYHLRRRVDVYLKQVVVDPQLLLRAVHRHGVHLAVYSDVGRLRAETVAVEVVDDQLTAVARQRHFDREIVALDDARPVVEVHVEVPSVDDHRVRLVRTVGGLRPYPPPHVKVGHIKPILVINRPHWCVP